MTDLPSLFFKSAGLGLAVAAPVGPMSLLCMRRTLEGGWRAGLAVGAGIALGDGAYAAIAAAGLASLSHLVLAHPRLIAGAAGAVLLVLGVRGLIAPVAEAAATVEAKGSTTRAIATAAALTLANPPTLAMFAALFAGLAPAGGFSTPVAAATVCGVTAGSMGWWLFVAGVLSRLRHSLSHRARAWISRAGAVVVAGFGVVEVLRAVIQVG
jgi:threonine/homoserine/homoserine lactone efflux protein